jgi:hypothetical protein
MKRTIVLPFISAFLAVGLIVLLVGANIYTFHRLTDEAPVAELTFVEIGPEHYQATIHYGDFCEAEQYILYGNQWRLDARFLKWRSWANLFGLDAMYRIERLGGRYRGVSDENSRQRSAYKLYKAPHIDLASVLQDYNGIFSPVDTLYGSSVYEDMNEDFRYRVYRSQSGLLVRKEHLTAGNIITIEINSACASRTGLLSGIAGYTERFFQAAGI